MSVIDVRDVRVAVTFAEEEARFLGGLVHAAMPYLTKEQRAAAKRIAAKFLLNGEAAKRGLVERHGMEAVLTVAESAMEAYPDIEEVALP